MGLHPARPGPLTVPPQVKQGSAAPAGALPEGMLNKVMVGLGTALVLALIISAGFCGGGENADDPAVPAGDASTGTDAVQPGEAVDRELQDAIERQQRALDAAEAAAARAEAQRLLADQAAAAAAAAAETDAARNLIPAMRQALIDSLGVLPDPDMLEIQRQADLEALARRITSVRASPVALTFRDQRQSAPPGGVDGENADPAEPNLLDAFAGATGLLQPQPGGQPAAGELDLPVPSSNRLPDYDNPSRLLTPTDPRGWERVYEGSFLEAVLATRLEGEFPGPVLATVSVPFYSADRQRVLIPRGARLIGSYQQVRRRDQSALAVGFHRLIFLDGRHVPLRFIGLDQAGSTGLRDEVNRHYLSTFLAAGAVGILSGFALVAGNPYGGGIGPALSGAGSGIAATGDDILDRYLNRLPTITIREGQRLRVWFTSDVLLPIPPPSRP